MIEHGFMVLNRDLAVEDGGWHHLVPVGEFEGVVMRDGKPVRIEQVFDQAAMASIMAAYREAAATPNWRGYLLDIEHFSHDVDKTSEAAGWYREIELRADGIWGRPELTDLGEQLITTKRYKSLSPALDLERLSENRSRPVRLVDVGLTNKPKLKTLVPIQNRDRNMEDAQMLDRLRTLLGLADATEDQVVNRVEQALNKEQETEQLKTRAETAEGELNTMKEEALNRDAATFVETHKALIKDPDAVKTLFCKNRDAAEAMIAAMKTPEAKADESTGKQRTLNRADTKTPDGTETSRNRDSERAAAVSDYRIKNRCSFQDAWDAVRSDKPELFEQGE